MAWLKLDDGFVEHPKVEALTSPAFRLHVTALCLSARKLTDGLISDVDARVCGILARSNKRHISELEDAGLWHRNGAGWQINDYLDYNPSAQQVKAEREQARERMRNVRANVPPNKKRTTAARSPVRSGTPSRPVPKDLKTNQPTVAKGDSGGLVGLENVLKDIT